MGFTNNLYKWQNYVHYLVNAILMFAEFYLLGVYDLGLWTMFLAFTGLLFINDTIIHAIFYFLPKKYGQWRD